MGKNAIKIDEGTLKKMIAESVKNVLKEGYDWFHENDGPSQEEENFEDALYSLIDSEGLNIAQAYGKENFIKWCVEIIEKAIG